MGGWVDGWMGVRPLLVSLTPFPQSGIAAGCPGMMDHIFPAMLRDGADCSCRSREKGFVV